jgi:sialate O-acetylesterase
VEGIELSPVFASMRRDGGRLVIHFENAASGLTTNDGQPVREFQVAGADGAYVAARAVIQDGHVVAWSETVSDPVAVRYAWHEKAWPNLVSGAGLPVFPFQSSL